MPHDVAEIVRKLVAKSNSKDEDEDEGYSSKIHEKMKELQILEITGDTVLERMRECNIEALTSAPTFKSDLLNGLRKKLDKQGELERLFNTYEKSYEGEPPAGTSAADMNSDADSGAKTLARLAQIFKVKHKKKPHNVQICAILAMLYGEKELGENFGSSCVTNIHTGQGKSFVLQLTAAFFALRGMQVSIVCHDDYLRNRDMKNAEKFFEAAEEEAGVGGFKTPVKFYSYGQLLEFLGENKKAGKMKAAEEEEAKRVLLVDEVLSDVGPEPYAPPYPTTHRRTPLYLAVQVDVFFGFAHAKYLMKPDVTKAHFHRIYGVSGSLQTMMKSQLELMFKHYGIDRLLFMPSFYTSKDGYDLDPLIEPWNKDLVLQICESTQAQHDAALKRVKELKKEQAVLVFFRDNRTLEACKKAWQRKLEEIGWSLRTLKDGDDIYKVQRYIDGVSGMPSSLTLAHEVFSRGRDFTFTPQVNKARGCHVRAAEHWPRYAVLLRCTMVRSDHRGFLSAWTGDSHVPVVGSRGGGANNGPHWATGGARQVQHVRHPGRFVTDCWEESGGPSSSRGPSSS